MPRKDKAARQAYNQDYRARNKDKLDTYNTKWRAGNREHLRVRTARRALAKRAMCMVAWARVRARRKGVEFALDDFVEALQVRIDAGRCEMSGVEFDLSPGRGPRSPSLDRRDPAKGYTPDNVRVICFALNSALGDWGDDALAPIMAGWLANRKETE